MKATKKIDWPRRNFLYFDCMILSLNKKSISSRQFDFVFIRRKKRYAMLSFSIAPYKLSRAADIRITFEIFACQILASCDSGAISASVSSHNQMVSFRDKKQSFIFIVVAILPWRKIPRKIYIVVCCGKCSANVVAVSLTSIFFQCTVVSQAMSNN